MKPDLEESFMNYYERKSALVMGGSEGIGLAVAQELVSRGSHVTVCSRNPEKLKSALQAMESVRIHPQQKLSTYSVDVTDDSSVSHGLESILAKDGPPDFLMNSAGFALPKYFEDLETREFRQMMEVNYFGIVNVIKAVYPAMRRARRGHIVNVSSMAGYLGLFGYTGYCASKYAVIGFSEALRNESKSFGIYVSVLCPPNTKTPGFAKENEKKPKEVLKMEEKVKTVDPQWVARALLRALPRHPFLINPTLDSKIVYEASRLTPYFLRDYFLRGPSRE
jgi:3-dehydrosphinganine reductase